MKATGIVRRIDDLGRVVIPKEIRRTMRIREGDPLEIYTNTDGEVIFKKYSAINEMSENAVHVADVINKLAGCPVVIFDRDHVVATSGVSKKEFAERRVTPSLEGVMESRTNYFKTGENAKLQAAEGIEKSAIAAVPIISSGDVTGAVVFMEHENDAMINDLQKSLANAAAQFLGRQIEGGLNPSAYISMRTGFVHSKTIVNGPSLRSLTFISAPKIPVSTTGTRFLQ